MSIKYSDSIRSMADQQNIKSPEGRELMGLLVEAMESVTIDDEQFMEMFKQILDGYNKEDNKNLFLKLISSFGSLFGVHIISKGDQLELAQATLNNSNTMLTVNQTKLAVVLNKFTIAANAIEERESTLKRLNVELEDKLAAAVREAENIKTQMYSLQNSEESDETDILKYVQRMLAEKRDVYDRENPVEDAFVQFTEHLEVSWSWDAEKYKSGFTSYKISDQTKEGVRLPCLFKDGKVVVKGLRYQYAPENE